MAESKRTLILVGALVTASCWVACGSSGEPPSGSDASANDAGAPSDGVAPGADGSLGDANAQADAATQHDEAGADAGACTSPSQCQVPAGTCYPYGAATCENGACGAAYTVPQIYGDCRENACDGAGNLTTSADDTNTYDDGNPCMTYPCQSGEAGAPASKALGTSCALAVGTNGFCEPSADPSRLGAVVCAECDPGTPSSCGVGLACSRGKCVAAHCMNTTKDPSETDVDCGGTDCLPCGAGKACNAGTDCFSQICTGHQCASPSCADGVRNGDETDTDCGGADCPKCAANLGCVVPSDCTSGVCRPPAAGAPNACAPSTCDDGVQNGVETGIDCGGDAGCAPCGPDGG